MTNIKNVGKVNEIRDGIVISDGLSEASYNEIVNIFSKGKKTLGLVLNLEKNQTGIIVLEDYEHIQEGDRIEATGKQLSIQVDEKILRNIVDPLGKSLESNQKVVSKGERMPLEKVAPGVIERKNVDRPLQTGIKAIDAMFPIGKGQRELIIGDRQTGKTAIGLDAIVNQKGKDVQCIYVAIGQKASKIAQIKAKLESLGAMEYTVIVAANASDPAALQYIAPYSGCAIGEHFAQKGKDALIIYDDLTKHSWAYREISLLLKRPPGREAYPGDIFYLHSKLLERALQYNEKNGGGSLTALPVVETQAGDVSAYIPTNIISITDGQIYLESELFNSGQKPAVNVGISVSRVGGDAQKKAMKQVSGTLKLDLAQYRELAAFAQFGSDLDEETRKKLDRGARTMEILKQPQYNPLPLGIQVAIIYAATNGYLDHYEIKNISRWENKFIQFMNAQGSDLLAKLQSGSELDEKLEKKLKSKIEEFNKRNGIEKKKQNE